MFGVVGIIVFSLLIVGGLLIALWWCDPQNSGEIGAWIVAIVVYVVFAALIALVASRIVNLLGAG